MRTAAAFVDDADGAPVQRLGMHCTLHGAICTTQSHNEIGIDQRQRHPHRAHAPSYCCCCAGGGLLAPELLLRNAGQRRPDAISCPVCKLHSRRD